MVRTGLPLLLVIALFAAGCGDGREDAASEASQDASAPATTAAAEPRAAADGCRPAEEPAAREVPDLEAPETRLDASKRYIARLKTNCGTIEIALDSRRAPRTVASFVSLARKDFYDGTPFHRVVQDFVIQGGDPTGTGNEGPGYSVVEPPPEGTTYSTGTVAMAKTELEEPGTSGSQFFIVSAEEPPPLQADYAIVGKVTDGMDVVQRIESVATNPADDRPIDPVVLQDVEIVTRPA